MVTKLSDDDRRAIDLLLNKTCTSSASANGFLPPEQTVVPQSLQSVERILSLLKQLPATEPSSDLVTRTLRRCQQAALSGEAAHPAAQTDQQPAV